MFTPNKSAKKNNFRLRVKIFRSFSSAALETTLFKDRIYYILWNEYLTYILKGEKTHKKLVLTDGTLIYFSLSFSVKTNPLNLPIEKIFFCGWFVLASLIAAVSSLSQFVFRDIELCW